MSGLEEFSGGLRGESERCLAKRSFLVGWTWWW